MLSYIRKDITGENDLRCGSGSQQSVWKIDVSFNTNQLPHCSVSIDALDVTEMDSIYSQPLRAKGLDLVACITCSGVNPEKFRGVAAKYERYFNQVCETAAQKEETGLPNTEEASVNSVMQAALRELGLKM